MRRPDSRVIRLAIAKYTRVATIIAGAIILSSSARLGGEDRFDRQKNVTKVSEAQADQSFETAFRDARALLAKGDYLSAIERVKPFALTDDGRIKDASAFQVWDQIQAMVTGAPSPLKQDHAGVPDPQGIAFFSQSEHRDAIATIVARARATRVVILNENHDTPCQRIFAASVALALRPLGYDTLALEGLATVPATTAASLQARGYPQYGDGFYVRDPAFARFIRSALEKGFAPFAYEYNPPRNEGVKVTYSREEGQARNLTRYLAVHPTSKLLVYSGGGHLAERPLEDGSKMMGQWLLELSGIDPLTIDQNQLQPNTLLGKSIRRTDDRHETIAFFGGKPLVLGAMGGRVDLQVMPAPTNQIRGRPACQMDVNSKLKRVKISPRTGESNYLLQAFEKKLDEKMVPIDQLLITSDMAYAYLILPEKPVRLQRRRN